MKFGLNDIAPDVAKAFAATLHTAYFEFATRQKSPEWKHLVTALSRERWLGEGWRTFVPVVGAFACVMIGAQIQGPPWVTWGLFGSSVLWSSSSMWQTFRRDLAIGFRTHLPAEVLTAAMTLMTLTPSERAYAETLVRLAALPPIVGDETAGTILLGLNELLAQDKAWEAQRQPLAAAVAQHPVAVLKAEQARLEVRWRETDDAETRQSLQQSLERCASRREDAEMMERNMERVTAQQEAIRQTFASVQSSLLRWQTTPSLAAPAAEVMESVTQIQRLTQAAEAAEREVARLSAQG